MLKLNEMQISDSLQRLLWTWQYMGLNSSFSKQPSRSNSSTHVTAAISEITLPRMIGSNTTLPVDFELES